MPAPMPFEAPVTIATFPASLLLSILLSFSFLVYYQSKPSHTWQNHHPSYLPDARSPLSVITVLVTCATNLSSSRRMSQTYRLICRPTFTGLATARLRPFQTGRKRLICISILVKLSEADSYQSVQTGVPRP